MGWAASGCGALLVVHAVAAPLLTGGLKPAAALVAVAGAGAALGASVWMWRRVRATEQAHVLAEEESTEAWRELAAARSELEQLKWTSAQAGQAAEQRHLQMARALDAVRSALSHLVERQLPVLAEGTQAELTLPADATPGVLAPDTAVLLERLVAEVGALAQRRHRELGSMRQTQIALARRLQASALEIAGQAQQMVREMPEDPVALRVSARVEHAAAQQARYAQSVVTLAGEWPGQQWQNDEPLVEVVRAASGRMTAFDRVQVAGDREVAVASPIVETVIHLIAELLANAAQSSPPTTAVQVQVYRVQRGAVVEIDDAGLGLRDNELSALRQVAAGQRPVRLEDMGAVPQTGLAVVGRYARRHNIGVDLAASPYGGVRAIVLIPQNLVTTVPLAIPPFPHPNQPYGDTDPSASTLSGSAPSGSAPFRGTGASLGGGAGSGPDGAAGTERWSAAPSAAPSAGAGPTEGFPQRRRHRRGDPTPSTPGVPSAARGPAHAPAPGAAEAGGASASAVPPADPAAEAAWIDAYWNAVPLTGPASTDSADSGGSAIPDAPGGTAADTDLRPGTGPGHDPKDEQR
ncbi:ATP-binding protein [Actinomadura violacea]|uniref:histidine kinase n=1 Tax=Actinomadura violacea TaxID=2819934 RepID=A0ABS3RZQ0_9ACTN|nr:ATP-binding protein [Actinomadura violacea]MBO2461529.1 hypothetical protein [Actinomadura violacea]